MKHDLKLDLGDLRCAPCQTWGAVRLAPLLGPPVEDLRLAPRALEAYGIVRLDGHEQRPKTIYAAWMPAALVLRWSPDGQPVADPSGWVGEPDHKLKGCVLDLHRLVKREDDHQLRFLPLHLAVDGLLSLHFGGPDIAWRCWSQRAIRTGLSPRAESFLGGRDVPDLGDALRHFEIHRGQRGVLVFVGDSLASAFVTPHPDDYRALHDSVVEDLFAETLLWHGRYNPDVPQLGVRLEETGVHSLDDLRAALTRAVEGWASFRVEGMAAGLLGRTVRAERVRSFGRFQMSRFLTGLDASAEQHVGECILDEQGRLLYLKSARLEPEQIARAAALDHLARHDWRLDRAAADKGTTEAGLRVQLTKLGLGWMFTGAPTAP